MPGTWIKRQTAVHELVCTPKTNKVIRHLAALVGGEADRRLVWKDGRTDDEAPEFEALEREVTLAQAYLWSLWHGNAYRRSGSLDAWHAAVDLGFDELVRRGQAQRAAFNAQLAALTPAERERRDAEQDRRDAERTALEEACADGFYDYSIPYTSRMDEALYIRLGPVPRGGRSHFGLAGEDSEDGPDDWRQEMGGKTTENGFSVFQAHRHPDVPGAYVLMEPCFDKARYGVRGWEDYLETVVPTRLAEDPASVPVLRIDGCVATCVGTDRRTHVDLGSDGEFLIDPAKPYTTTRLAPELVYVDPERPLTAFLEQRLRGPGYR